MHLHRVEQIPSNVELKTYVELYKMGGGLLEQHHFLAGFVIIIIMVRTSIFLKP